MSCAISPSTRFCAPVGLNGSIALIFSRTRSFSSNAMPGTLARLAALQRDPALQPEELLEDQAELRRRAERVQQPQVGSRAAGKWMSRMAVQRSGSFSRSRDDLRQAVVRRGAIASRIRCINVRSIRVVTLPAAS